MGYGFRQEIINKKETENIPSAQDYNLRSIFLDNLNKEKGPTLSQKLNYKVKLKINNLF